MRPPTQLHVRLPLRCGMVWPGCPRPRAPAPLPDPRTRAGADPCHPGSGLQVAWPRCSPHRHIGTGFPRRARAARCPRSRCAQTASQPHLKACKQRHGEPGRVVAPPGPGHRVMLSPVCSRALGAHADAVHMPRRCRRKVGARGVRVGGRALCKCAPIAHNGCARSPEGVERAARCPSPAPLPCSTPPAALCAS